MAEGKLPILLAGQLLSNNSICEMNSHLELKWSPEDSLAPKMSFVRTQTQSSVTLGRKS